MKINKEFKESAYTYIDIALNKSSSHRYYIKCQKHSFGLVTIDIQFIPSSKKLYY